MCLGSGKTSRVVFGMSSLRSPLDMWTEWLRRQLYASICGQHKLIWGVAGNNFFQAMGLIPSLKGNVKWEGKRSRPEPWQILYGRRR